MCSGGREGGDKRSPGGCPVKSVELPMALEASMVRCADRKMFGATASWLKSPVNLAIQTITAIGNGI